MGTKHPGTEYPETNEYRIIGPPGCGKTTWLQKKVGDSCREGKNPLIVSLTKAAAAEVAGRHLPVASSQVGTLHSQCFHALGMPQIAESKDNLPAWNETNEHYKLTSNEDLDRDNLDVVGQYKGDRLMAEYQRLRARRTPREAYPEDVLFFATEWEAWKYEASLLDYTDLIEQSLTSISEAPGNPDIIFVDEAQDMNLLEMTLLRKWGESAQHLVIVGDPDQSLYGWRGSDPEAFLHHEIPPERKRVLSQSYRVPRSVHSLAMQWIDMTPNREPVQYRPTEQEGETRFSKATWQAPHEIVQDMERYLEEGKTVMVIASCAYMLETVIEEARAEGIPFHNPQRPKNARWNPLQKKEGSTSASDRLLAWLGLSETGMPWSSEEVRRFASSMKLREMFQGRKIQGTLDTLVDDEVYDADNMNLSWKQIHELTSPEGLEAALTRNLGWYVDAQSSDGRHPAEYPAEVARKRGPETLREKPLLTVGSIHSTKGGEADVVYIFPDISPAGAEEWWAGGEKKASIYRTFYVGLTRAKETLVICQGYKSGLYVPIRN